MGCCLGRTSIANKYEQISQDPSKSVLVIKTHDSSDEDIENVDKKITNSDDDDYEFR